MSERKRQQMVMMGPGFGQAIGGAFIWLFWLAVCGWALAIIGGICWLIFG